MNIQVVVVSLRRRVVRR